MNNPIVTTNVSKPYVEILVPGPQGPQGDEGPEFLVYSGASYPARESASRPVIFVGPVDPGGLVLAGDAWVNTSGNAPVSSVNGETGAVVLDHTDVGAKVSSYVPDWSEITNKPDYQTQINNKLDTATAPELIRDTIGTALVAGSNITLDVNDAADTITISSSGGGGGAVSSVNGFTGVVVLAAGDVGAVPTSRTINGKALSANVTLVKADIGLGSVDNTADAAKVVASAAKLTTARTINGVSFDGTANITIPVTSSFVMGGNVPGDLSVGDLVEGGVAIPVNVTLDKMLLTVDREPRGSSLSVQVFKRERVTGTETSLGTATFASGVKRATLTGLAASLLVDDRIMMRCTGVGSSQSGAGLAWTMSDSLGTSFPAALSAPAAPTGASAVASGAADVLVSWTAPASGSYYAVDVWKDGSFLTRVLKGTTSYLDEQGADDDHAYTLYAVNTDATSTAATANFSLITGIQNPVSIGSGISNVVSDTVVITTTTSVASGDMIVLMGSGTVPTGLPETWTVTDSRSNSWTTHVHSYDNSHTQQTWIATTRVTTNIQAGDTITCTGTNATARLAIAAYSVAGIAASNRFDVSQSNLSSSSTRNMTTNSTATLAQTNEIAFVAFSSLTANTGTSTEPVVAGSGWLLGTTVKTTAGSNDRMLTPLWRITSSTAALAGTATLNASSQYSGSIATFKGA